MKKLFVVLLILVASAEAVQAGPFARFFGRQPSSQRCVNGICTPVVPSQSPAPVEPQPQSVAAARRPITALRVRQLWNNRGAREEIRRRVRAELGFDVTTIQQLLDLFVQYAPQLLKIIADVLAMFS